MALRLDKRVEAELRAIQGNEICCDCEEKSPQWASVSFGVFMCLECSGRHRSLGVHISFVRSVSMDSWTKKQIAMMRAGGNAKCVRYLQAAGVVKNTPIAQKYNSPPALLYKERLLAEVEGRELPTELPKSNPSAGSGSAPAALGGSDPLPGETEEQYVKRQRQLQAEARERMRAKFGSSQGLRSSTGGAMQGIGSDPNYNPNSTGDYRNEISSQIGDASQKALSFFSSVWETTAKTVQEAHIGEQVSSVWDTLSTSRSAEQPATFRPREETNPSQNPLIDLSDGSGMYYGNQSPSGGASQVEDPLVSGWNALSTGAIGLWQKASAAVTELVEEPSEDDYKFPRPNGSPSVATSSTATAPFPATTNYRGNSPSITPPQSNSSVDSNRSSSISDNWDNLSPPDSRSTVQPLGRPPSVSGSGVRGSASDPSFSTGTTMSSSVPRVSSGNTINRGTSPLAVRSGNNNSPARGSSTSSSQPAADGDDFFSSFGFK